LNCLPTTPACTRNSNGKRCDYQDNNLERRAPREAPSQHCTDLSTWHSRAIAAGLQNEGFAIRCSNLDDPDEGLGQQLLEDTDALLWWGHIAHEEVTDALVDRIQQRVLKGMAISCQNDRD